MVAEANARINDQSISLYGAILKSFIWKCSSISKKKKMFYWISNYAHVSMTELILYTYSRLHSAYFYIVEQGKYNSNRLRTNITILDLDSLTEHPHFIESLKR